jgi:Carbohydrate phosphorylase
VLYDRLRQNPELEMAPRTFFFAGKAAPAYHLAKVIIKFLNNLAGTIDGDPAVRGRLKVVFLPEYCVSLAERLIPATDVSNQISTAGYPRLSKLARVLPKVTLLASKSQSRKIAVRREIPDPPSMRQVAHSCGTSSARIGRSEGADGEMARWPKGL